MHCIASETVMSLLISLAFHCNRFCVCIGADFTCALHQVGCKITLLQVPFIPSILTLSSFILLLQGIIFLLPYEFWFIILILACSSNLSCQFCTHILIYIDTFSLHFNLVSQSHLSLSFCISIAGGYFQ